jgi:hypothetical protein
LPNPNGYDDFLKAGAMITGRFDDIKKLNIEELRGLVETNAEPLRLLRLGLSRSCSVDTEAAINDNFAGSAVQLPTAKKLAQLLAAEGRLREMENRPTDAAQSYLDAIQLGSKSSEGGFLINRLVGIACEAIATVPLVKLIPQMNAEQLRPLLPKLEQIGSNYISWDDILANEKRYAYRQVMKRPPSIFAIPQARAATSKAQQKHDVAATHFRLLTLEVALRCYRFEHAQSPQDLGQLVPKYLHQLPADPFSGRNMVYSPEQGTNWLLYSIGTNRVDNDGQRGADMFFDSAW